MKIELIHPDSQKYPKLQEFVEKHQVLFNSAAWTGNYPAENIFQCVILNKNEEIIGCFVYFRFTRSFFKFVITAPYAPSIDLFYLNPAESVVGKNSFNKDLVTELASYFDGLNVPYININLPYSVVDTQPFIWRGYTSKTRYSYLIDLSRTEEELWSNLSPEKRKSVNILKIHFA